MNALVAFKLGHSSRRHLIIRIGIWVIIFCGILFAEPIYNYLFSNNLTQTEPLSLFDVVQITGIVLVFFIANRALTRVDYLEGRVQSLHQELSIRLAADESPLPKGKDERS
jgi:hypothetical protein